MDDRELQNSLDSQQQEFPRRKRRSHKPPVIPPLANPKPLSDRHKRVSGLRSFAWTAYQVNALRRRLGISTWELAAELNVRHGTVRRWESGDSFPRGAEVRLLDLIAQEVQFTDRDPLIRWLESRDVDGYLRRNWAAGDQVRPDEAGYMGAEGGEDLVDKELL